MAKARVKARVTIQEPENTLITAPPKPKVTGQIFIVTKLKTMIRVNGADQVFAQPEDGIIGFMVALDDYEKALKWADGDTSLIMIGTRS